MSEEIARQWLEAVVTTAGNMDIQGIKILEAADGRILFKTCETVEGTDGTVIPRASRSCCNARKTTSGASCRSGF
ncbi:MAG: hypothetical protein P8Y83_10575 [Gammaproteobacteria bacterium]